jgi:hypothetical protein
LVQIGYNLFISTSVYFSYPKSKHKNPITNAYKRIQIDVKCLLTDYCLPPAVPLYHEISKSLIQNIHCLFKQLKLVRYEKFKKQSAVDRKPGSKP